MVTALPPNPPMVLSQVYNVRATDVMPVSPFKGLRAEAQKEAAYSLGVQAGVSWRYDQINNVLWAQAAVLDQLYNFRPMMLNDGKVMPPVVTMGEDTFDLQDRTTAQGSIVTWHIIAPAKIVSVVPTWASYLIQHYGVDLSSVNAALLPKNDAEKKLWHTYVMQGWSDGIDHANRLYTIALANLTRDFLGVARFQLLAREGMLSVPDLAVGDMGVVINKDTMLVGAKVYRIVEDAKWQKIQAWQAHPGS